MKSLPKQTIDAAKYGSVVIRPSQIKAAKRAGLRVHVSYGQGIDREDRYRWCRGETFAASPEWVMDYRRSGGIWEYSS